MKITIVSMYHYNPNLFDGIAVPEGMDRAALINSILLHCGEFGSLYTDPEFLQECVTLWSDTSQYTWAHLFQTTRLDYNPISNYDRTEDTTKAVAGNAVNKETSFDSYTLQNTSGSESDGTETTHSVIKGNIGVTTTQKMIEEEREVSKYNVYEDIARDFAYRFCIETF